MKLGLQAGHLMLAAAGLYAQNVTISGGGGCSSVIGSAHHGASSGWPSVQVGGVPVWYQPGNLTNRRVLIGDDIDVTVGPECSSSTATNKVRVEVQNGQLFVNGMKADFSGKNPSVRAPDPAALQALQKRFPGVVFSGSPEAGAIGPQVSIAAGAKVDLSRGTKILGNSIVGATAQIGGGARVSDSTVHGSVTGMTLSRSVVAAGASVTGAGTVNNTRLQPGATIAGSVTVDASILREQARIEGSSTVSKSVLGPRAVVSGSTSVSTSELSPNSKISGSSEISGQGTPETARAGWSAR